MTAGSSGTPLASKLGVKPAATVAVLDAPDSVRVVWSGLRAVWREGHRAGPAPSTSGLG